MPFPFVLLCLAALLLMARAGALVERFGQPPVLGELAVGIALGALAFIPGLDVIDAIRREAAVHHVAEAGAILLLFRAGLESDLGEMRRVGGRAFLVACVGVAVPFALGALVSPLLMPGLSAHAAVFIGATLTATSVGITARVFKDLGALGAPEARIVLGAAVIDDVLGLLILAVVSDVIRTGSLELAPVAVISLKALAFLAGSIVLGQMAAPRIGRALSRLHAGHGMKAALALLFCAAFACAASISGLAPIVGAFAAGLVLDPVHFTGFLPPEAAVRLRGWAERHPDHPAASEMSDAAQDDERAHVENLVEGLAACLVPIFFIYTGLQVDLSAFGDAWTVLIALAITAVAVLGKLASGLVAGKGRDKLLVGVGMVPRGEVGLIFAGIGRALGVVDDRLFAVIVIVIVLTTLVAPPALNALVKRRRAA